MTQARRDAVARVKAWGRDDLAADVAIVVTELVANAVLHGRGCTGIELLPIADGIRVEVCDRSTVPPVMSIESPHALTGRGLRLVSTLSARWGADRRGRGKAVWAEINGQPAPINGEFTDADLLAMWGEPWDVADAAPTFHLELGDVPTDLLLAAKSHVDSLVREFALASAGAAAGLTAEVPAHLSQLLRAVVDDFAAARVSIKHQALEAARQGEQRTRLALDLPLSAVAAAQRYVDALDKIDAYCHAKRLLTRETPPEHRAFRRWYISQLVAQLQAAAAGEPAPPIESFERRLLAELRRLSDAHRVSERAARLYTVAAALATAATPEAVAAAVLDEGVAALGADAGGVLLGTDAEHLLLPGAVGYDEGVLARLRTESRDAELPAAAALRTGTPVWLESRVECDARFPQLAGLEAGTVSLCAVPLVVQDDRLGALRFSFGEARLFDEDERRFVQALAAMTAQALARVYRADHEAAPGGR